MVGAPTAGPTGGRSDTVEARLADALEAQVKRNVRAGIGEQPRALADDHGDDEQVDLVNEVVLEQPPDQRAAAMHLQLTPGLAFSSPMAQTPREPSVTSA
jgi:hypothetical protein